MARNFGNNKANYLQRGSSIISNTDPRPISVAVWLKAASRGVKHVIFNNNKSSNPLCLMFLDLSGADDVQRFYSAGYAADSNPFTLSTVAWTHLGWSWDTDGDIEYWLNGAANGVANRGIGGDTTDLAVIGTLDGAIGGWDIDGDLAEFAVWDVILTPSEWATLAAGYSPLFVRPQSLVSYVPIIGRNSPEPDRVDAATWAINGTLTVAPHPPMLYPAPLHLGYVSAAAPPPTIIPLAMHHYRSMRL